MRFLLLLLLTFSSFTANALSAREEAFLQVGIEVFPAIIKSIATPEISKKPIFIIYTPDSKNLAQLAAKQLEQKLNQKTSLIAEEVFIKSIQIQPNEYAAGILFFTSSSLHKKNIKLHTDTTQQLVFSPFIEAAKNYTDIGILITDQVKPTVNLKNIANKKIEFKQFFYKVAKSYDK